MGASEPGNGRQAGRGGPAQRALRRQERRLQRAHAARLDGRARQDRRPAQRRHRGERDAGRRPRPGQPRRRPGGQALASASPSRRLGPRVGREHRVGQQPDRRPGAPDQRDAARHRGGRRRRPEQEDQRRRRGRGPRAQAHHQRDGRPAQPVRLRGHARRSARSAPRASSVRRPP